MAILRVHYKYALVIFKPNATRILHYLLLKAILSRKQPAIKKKSTHSQHFFYSGRYAFLSASSRSLWVL